jgi:hypothetical protein
MNRHAAPPTHAGTRRPGARHLDQLRRNSSSGGQAIRCDPDRIILTSANG